MAASSFRVSLKLCGDADSALIRALSGNNRSKKTIYNAFLTKAEMILRYTRLKEEDFRVNDELSGEVIIERPTVSKINHPLLYRLYNSSPHAFKRVALHNVLRRCAVFLEEQPESFELLASQMILEDNKDLIIDSQDDDQLINSVIDGSTKGFEDTETEKEQLPLMSVDEESDDTIMMTFVDDLSEIL